LEELEGEVDAFKFTEPALCLGERASGDEVGVDVVEAADHDRVGLEHGAEDTSVFVLAGGDVGAPAVAQIDHAFIEVLFESGPFHGGRRTVFLGRAGGTPPAEVGLVMPDDVFLENGDVAVGGLYIEVPEEGSRCELADRN
jgi:hypothetical protein